MGLASFFFYIFASITVASGFMVITSRNPVYSVLFLILAFFNSAGLFLLLGAEFLAMILVIVYVGAVAVLFLFVVMMLDIDFAELREGYTQYLPFGALIGAILLIELVLVVGAWSLGERVSVAAAASPIPPLEAGITNTEALGRVLFTKYAFFLEAAGVLLLVAMIGAIVLTLRAREGVRRQSPAEQVARDPAGAVSVVKVPSGGSVFPRAESNK